MQTMKISITVFAVLIGAALPAHPQDLASVRHAIEAKYALTTTTADKTDIVTTGTVLIFKKSNFVAVDATKSNLFKNTYKNGRITQNAIKVTKNVWDYVPGHASVGGAERKFVSGEKIWVTAVNVSDKNVVFTLFSDAFGDPRYGGTLTFPFGSGADPNGMIALIAEVFDVQEADNGGRQQTARNNPGFQPAEAATPAPPPIVPPPPPAPDPKTIALGQTTDQVVNAFGQPSKIVKQGAKQDYVYPDMTVTFVAGIVTDVR
jgi:hypothetical protein